MSLEHYDTPAQAVRRWRFTAWLTERERWELENASARMNLSINQTLRVALRAGLGLPVDPAQAQAVKIRQEES